MGKHEASVRAHARRNWPTLRHRGSTLGEMELGGSFPERGEGVWREKAGGRMRLCYVDGEERPLGQHVYMT